MALLKFNWEGNAAELHCYVPNFPRSTGPHGKVAKTGKKSFAGRVVSHGTVYDGRSRADAQRAVESALVKHMGA